jgi:chromosome partitioning protein
MSTIAFVSQSGNVMKSTLATATALETMQNDIDVAVADLDVENRSITSWIKQREEYGITPLFKVYSVNSAKEAINCFQGEQVCIIDAPSRATSATIEVALKSDLIIQPTTPGKKDMDLAIETFLQLIKKGVPLEKLLFVITRIGSESELQKAIQYLNLTKIGDKNIKILSSAIWEKVSYRSAINDGLAITETPYNTLNESAKSVVHQMLTLLIK